MKLLKITTVFFILISSLLLFSHKSAKSVLAVSREKKEIPILLYHHILKKNENTVFKNDPDVISLEEFESQMNYLHDAGYHTATISELEAYLRGEKTLPDKTVIITFDDGLKTNYVYAYPVLKKYGFKAVAFLITNRITKTPVPFDPKKLQPLSWPEINNMKDVFEFGSHTNGLHDKMKGIPALIKEPDQVVLQDLETSKKILNTNFFAYPFGTYNSRTIQLLKKAGYKYAFTTKAQDVKIGDNPYELGRIFVGPSTSLKVFKELVVDTGTKNSGWTKVDNKWYYYGSNGERKTGWLTLGNHRYYLNKEGIMQTGWLTLDGNTYYFNEYGVMATGWKEISGVWYYFSADGKEDINNVLVASN